MFTCGIEGFGIIGVNHYLPGPPEDIVRWGPMNDVSDGLVEKLLEHSCRHFHVSDPEEDDLSLVSSAYQKLLSEHCFSSDDVSIVIHARTQAYSVPPAPKSLVVDFVNAYGLKPDLNFSVTHLACASVINAVWLATQYLRSQTTDSLGLILTSDRVFGGGEYRMRQNSGIMSDGASAMLIGRKNVIAQVKRMCVDNNARHHAGPVNDDAARAIGQSAWYETRAVLHQTVSKAGLSWNDVKHVLPTNADAHYWSMIERTSGLGEGAVNLENIARRGHACSADFAVNLVDVGLDLIKGGETIISCGQSNVGAHAALLLTPPEGVSGHPPQISLPEIGIYDLAVKIPDDVSVTGKSKERAFQTFEHLIFTDSGRHSCPPMEHVKEEHLPGASCDHDLSLTDSTIDVIRKMLHSQRVDADQIAHIVNTQCMSNENILESSCLRIQHELFPLARTALTIDQMGTAGIPTGFTVAKLQLLDGAPEDLVCIAASDKWIPPFSRRFPGMTPLADASASCVVGRIIDGRAPIAIIDSQYVFSQPTPPDIWSARPEDLQDYIFESVIHAVNGLLQSNRSNIEDIDYVAGDGVSAELLRRIQSTLRIQQEKLINFQWNFGSSSPLIAIQKVIEQAHHMRRDLNCVVWTASLSGNAAAMHLKCRGQKQ